MLRYALIALLLANLLYAAWAAGGLRNFGLMPASQREPERVARQIEPQSMRVLPPEEAARMEASARGAQCLQSAPIAAARQAAVRDALAAWPLGSWVLDAAARPANAASAPATGDAVLRLPVVDESLRARLGELQAVLGAAQDGNPAGIALQPCR
ncbi:MAG: hypothetical protein ACKOCJ_00460 [Burkholderiaceae bacterium]